MKRKLKPKMYFINELLKESKSNIQEKDPVYLCV